MTARRSLTVQFYVYRNVHWPMFEALFEYLGTHPDVAERIICLPSLDRLKVGASHALSHHLLSLGVPVTSHPAQRPADVTFVADTVGGRVRGCGLIVNVGHGTISKGYYFTDSVWTERENWVDLLCVPGDSAADKFRSILRTRVVATGMPKLDPVFAGRFTREALCDRYRIDPGKRIVLYAPTFNDDLSSVYLFESRFREMARADRHVLIKLHGSTKPATVDAYRAMAAETPGLTFVDDPNIAPSLGGADVMISDVSSVFMEFMALDKPVILFDHPNMARYHGYNPADIEHAWRDLGTRTTDFESTLTALARVSADGDGKSAIRQRYAAQLFADRSGHAAERVWREVLTTWDAIGPPQGRAPLVPQISLLLQLTPDNLFLIRRLIDTVQFLSVMPIELRLVQVGTSPEVEAFLHCVRDALPFASMHVDRVDDIAQVEHALSLSAKAAAGDYVMFARPHVIVHRGFDYLLHKTFVNHPTVVALTTVTSQPGDAERSRHQKESLEGMTDERAAYQFINWHRGETIADFKSPTAPPVVIFRRQVLKHLPDAFMTGLAGLSNSGHLKVAASVLVAMMPGSLIQQTLQFFKADAASRRRLVIDLLNSGAPVLFSELAVPVMRTLIKAGATADELAGLMPMLLRDRHCDAAMLGEAKAMLARYPSLVAQVDRELEIVRPYLENVSASRRS